MILHQNVFKKNVDKKGKPTLDNDCDDVCSRVTSRPFSTCFVCNNNILFSSFIKC